MVFIVIGLTIIVETSVIFGVTPPKFNSSPLKNEWLEDDPFLLGKTVAFQGRTLKLREGTHPSNPSTHLPGRVLYLPHLEAAIDFLSEENPPKVGRSANHLVIPSSKLTEQWKIAIFNRKYIFKGSILHCYVSLPDCTVDASEIPFRPTQPPGLDGCIKPVVK